MSDVRIKQLRSLAQASNDGDLRGPALNAADQIERLTARIRELEAALRPLATEARCRCMYESRDTERAYESGECDHQRARRALALIEKDKTDE